MSKYKCSTEVLGLASWLVATLTHQEELNVPSTTYKGSKCVMSCLYTDGHENGSPQKTALMLQGPEKRTFQESRANPRGLLPSALR